ncbi:MAG: class I SAM-dependent methyltransferase [Myxococcota bacterium]
MSRLTRTLPVLAIALFLLVPSVAAAAEPQTTPERSDLNRRFVDPELDVDGWVERFESESREVYRAREAIVAETGLAAGMRVADVGAGTGLFVPLFAAAVGETGRVFAVDISPRFLEHLRTRAREAGLDQVEVVEGTDASIGLSDASVDVVFVCDTYHHFTKPKDSLASIHRALRPGGSLVIVEFEREPGTSRQWVLDHVRAGKATFRAEIEAAGFVFRREPAVPGLAENYLQVYEKPKPE